MRYKTEINDKLDRAVHDATLANLTEESALDFIQHRTGIRIEREQLFTRRRNLKAHRIRMWNAYKNNDYAYRLEHLERIHEAKLVKNLALEQILKYKDDETKHTQLMRAAYLMLEANKRITELVALIPEIDTIGHSDTYEPVHQEISGIPRTQGNPEAIF